MNDEALASKIVGVPEPDSPPEGTLDAHLNFIDLAIDLLAAFKCALFVSVNLFEAHEWLIQRLIQEGRCPFP